MTRPIEVLHLIHKLGDGGADHALTRLANHSDPSRFRHTILVMQPGPGYEPFHDGVTVIPLEPGADAASAIDALGWDRAARMDLVHGWVAGPSILAASLAAALGVPLILRQPTNMEEELRWEPAQADAYWPRLKLAFQAADAVISPSPALVENTQRVCGVTPIVVPNAIDVDAFDCYVGRTASRAFTMGFVGRLCHQKDPLTLIDALGQIDCGREWHLKMFGEGYLRETVEKRLRELQLVNRVTFAGFESSWHHPSSNVDLVVMPTRYEGMSNALLEAAAAGLPILTTNIPENRAALRDGIDALLVPVSNPTVLAKAIEVVMDHPSRARERARRARQHVRQFSVAAMVSGHERVYERLA